MVNVILFERCFRLFFSLISLLKLVSGLSSLWKKGFPSRSWILHGITKALCHNFYTLDKIFNFFAVSLLRGTFFSNLNHFMKFLSKNNKITRSITACNAVTKPTINIPTSAVIARIKP